MIMGLFGVAEVFVNVEAGIQQHDVFRTPIRDLLPGRRDWKAAAGPITRGSLLGFVLGILPGVGSIIPTFVSYALEKRLSRHPEQFGHGAIEGVAGPESANNAATAGSMIPVLTLGVAPNVVMAVLLGAFLIHGVQPGPLMLREHPDLFWGVVASMYVGNVMLLVLNLPLIGLWVQLLRVPYGVLFPAILLICATGVYGTSGNIWDVGVMFTFGVVGYVMRKTGYEPAPFVLAFVLGRLAEESFRQSLLISRGNLGILLDRPIAAGFLLAVLAVVAVPLLMPGARALLRSRALSADE
jgi:putative tricarboxylic transport membrane protein